MVILYPDDTVIGYSLRYGLREELVDVLISIPVWLAYTYLIYLIMLERP
jgi:hypothetical protein